MTEILPDYAAIDAESTPASPDPPARPGGGPIPGTAVAVVVAASAVGLVDL